MSVMLCGEVQACFSEYLDGALTGVQMEDMRSHLASCPGCRREFAQWKVMTGALASVGPAKVSGDLALRLRVAISQEAARPRTQLARLAVKWQNTYAPLALRFSAGLVSAVMLIGSVALLVGTFAAPEQAAARDEPIGMASPPRLLYTSGPFNGNDYNALSGSVVVRVYVDESGRVFDYNVLSGSLTGSDRTELETQMLWSTFEPAHVFGKPVSGSILLSLTGLSVPG